MTILKLFYTNKNLLKNSHCTERSYFYIVSKFEYKLIIE
jgi:hypothetical protein